MGVDLGEIVVKRKTSLEALSGKVIAIDAFNVLYQFLASIRQEDGTPLMDYKGNITAHLSGLFYRSLKLLENGIKPVYVFDGKPPELKEAVHLERASAKAEAHEKWKKALEEERLEEAKRYASATSRLTSEMVEESKELLDALGIPWIQAPGEGEAQSACMARDGLAYAAASQDFDSLLFGAPILIRNISITGRRKVPRQDRYVMIEPEEISLEETLSTLGINREQLITIGILIGTDYNRGVKGVGPKTALKIVREYSDFNSAIAYVEKRYNYEFEIAPREILDIFLNPPCAKIKERLTWKRIDIEAVVELLVRAHDFSEERVRKTAESVIKSLEEKGEQRSLGQWL
ncbi:MAG: flap endonuclease-1 [Candidatus Bilamarchaeaceae archaeon]